MSENTNSTPQNEDLDLIQLFKLIGQSFKTLFNFFKSILNGLFRVVIYSLKPFVKNIKMVSTILIIAALTGFFLEKSNKTIYTSDMLVRPYFESKYQLANNINYFNALIEEENTNELSRLFEIDSSESESLLGFKIEIGPQTKNDIIQEYNGFLKSIDSTIASDISYDDFVENRDVLDGSTFMITADASINNVFSKLEKGFGKTFQNKYSKKNKYLRDSSIVIEKTRLLRDLKSVDSIQKIYLEVIKTESEKESVILSNGDMTVSQEKTNTREYELLQEEMKIRNKLNVLEEKQIIESDFYDILSSFEDIGGVKKVSIYLRYPILFPLIAIGLMILTGVIYKTFYFVKEYE
ncbi:hypothetical protein N9H78_00730 [Winogradskyella sp.]|nr:hypothetical protein [Winogradskyella sp.]MDA8874179.1 hypothetical protein [Winogradskyella sp.]